MSPKDELEFLQWALEHVQDVLDAWPGAKVGWVGGLEVFSAVYDARESLSQEVQRRRSTPPQRRVALAVRPEAPEMTDEDRTYYGTKPRCALCGIGIGPDITGRPLCYGCGPQEMRPRLWTMPHVCGDRCTGPCDPRSRFVEMESIPVTEGL